MIKCMKGTGHGIVGFFITLFALMIVVILAVLAAEYIGFI